jgi:hypothetical protein
VVADKHWNAGCFTAAQQALLAFVAAVAAMSAVPDAAFNAMRLRCSDRQLVETIALTGNYFLIGRLTKELNVPLDPPPTTPSCEPAGPCTTTAYNHGGTTMTSTATREPREQAVGRPRHAILSAPTTGCVAGSIDVAGHRAPRLNS